MNVHRESMYSVTLSTLPVCYYKCKSSFINGSMAVKLFKPEDNFHRKCDAINQRLSRRLELQSPCWVPLLQRYQFDNVNAASSADLCLIGTLLKAYITFFTLGHVEYRIFPIFVFSISPVKHSITLPITLHRLCKIKYWNYLEHYMKELETIPLSYVGTTAGDWRQHRTGHMTNRSHDRRKNSQLGHTIQKLQLEYQMWIRLRYRHNKCISEFRQQFHINYHVTIHISQEHWPSSSINSVKWFIIEIWVSGWYIMWVLIR